MYLPTWRTPQIKSWTRFSASSPSCARRVWRSIRPQPRHTSWLVAVMTTAPPAADSARHSAQLREHLAGHEVRVGIRGEEHIRGRDLFRLRRALQIRLATKL